MNVHTLIVTYNRINLLKKTLDAFENMTIKPNRIVIVNNNSNDGTLEYLEQWNKKKHQFRTKVINLEVNMGGSGGFYEGMKEALKENFDWLWVSDDDAIPYKNSFEEFVKYIKRKKLNIDEISAICGQVISNDEVDLNHRRYLRKGILRIKETNTKKEDYEQEEFDINIFSYVGVFINVSKLKEIGLPRKEYFILYDDTEHAIRLNRVGKIICVPNIKITHDILKEEVGLNWKIYYGSRNKLATYKNQFGLRYFISEYIKISLKSYLSPNKEARKLYKSALHDIRNNNMGIHYIYKPGWKPLKR